MVVFVPNSWHLIDDWFQEPSERGAFGDQFRAVNALLSGLAFAGLLVAIFLQRRELQLQREELSLTRQELAGQRAELARRNQAAELAQFETTFFGLVRELRDQISIIGHGDKSGLAAFELLVNRFQPQAHPDPNKAKYSKIEPRLGHYFRLLYHCVRFVDCRDFDIEQKALYLGILRAQLSQPELQLICINGLYQAAENQAAEKWKVLIERYGLLKHLDQRFYTDWNCGNQYYATAFE